MLILTYFSHLATKLPLSSVGGVAGPAMFMLILGTSAGEFDLFCINGDRGETTIGDRLRLAIRDGVNT